MKKSVLILFVLQNLLLSAQEKYTLDEAHTLISFNVERFMVGEVSGKFGDFDGAFIYDEKNEKPDQVNIAIRVASIDTDHDVRDGHLKGKTWLDAESYPNIQFHSTKIYRSGKQLIAEGNLTIKDITRPVKFPFELKGPFRDPTRKVTLGIKGDLIINRQDFGLSFNKLMDNGEVFIGDEVRIALRVLAVKSE